MCSSSRPTRTVCPGCTALTSATSSALTCSVLTAWAATAAPAQGQQSGSGNRVHKGGKSAPASARRRGRQRAVCLQSSARWARAAQSPWQTARHAHHRCCCPAWPAMPRCGASSRPALSTLGPGAGRRRPHAASTTCPDGRGVAGPSNAGQLRLIGCVDGRHAGAGDGAPGAAARRGAGAAGQQRTARHRRAAATARARPSGCSSRGACWRCCAPTWPSPSTRKTPEAARSGAGLPGHDRARRRAAADRAEPRA